MPEGVFTMIRLSVVLLAVTVAYADTPRQPGPHPASQALENPIEMNEASAQDPLHL